MTHYKRTSHFSLNALTLGSTALPLLALSVVSQTCPVNHLIQRSKIFSLIIYNSEVRNIQSEIK